MPMAEFPKRPSLVRFSLRGLFLTTSVVAAASALLVGVAQLERGLLCIAIFTGVFILVLTWFCWRRLRVEAAAGAACVYCRAWQVGNKISVGKGLASAAKSHQRRNLFSTAWLCFTFLMWAFGVGMFLVEPLAPLWFILFGTVTAGEMAARVTVRVWWKHHSLLLEFCEHGLLWWLWFVPWTKLKRYEWVDIATGNLLVQFQGARWYLLFEPADVERVDAFLKVRIPPKRSDADRSAAGV